MHQLLGFARVNDAVAAPAAHALAALLVAVPVLVLTVAALDAALIALAVAALALTILARLVVDTNVARVAESPTSAPSSPSPSLGGPGTCSWL